ncbi:MAG: SPOR domain-containing protein [Bacteroidota bacterium]
MSPTTDFHLKSAFKELPAFSLPGVGTFRKVQHAARIDEQRHEIRPPETVFEYEESVDEELSLANHLKHQLNYSDEEAHEILSEIRVAISWNMKTKNQHEIPEVGVLHRHFNGKTSFFSTISDEGIMGGAYYGLRPISYQVGVPAVTSVPGEASDKTSTTGNPSGFFQQSTWGSALLIGLFLVLGGLIIFTGPFGSEESAVADNSPAAAVNAVSPEQDEPATEPAPQKISPRPTLSGQGPASQEPAPKVVSRSLPTQPGKRLQQPKNEFISDGAVPASAVTPQNTRSMGVPRGDNEGLAPSTAGPMLDLTAGTDPQGEPYMSLDIGLLDTISANANVSRMIAPVKAYHLIVGSFATLPLAREKVSELALKGHSPIILYPPVGSQLQYRVSIYHSPDRALVDTYKKYLKRQGMDGGWVFEER